MRKLIGSDPNQVPSNADLGSLAYQNADNAHIKSVKLDEVRGNFEWQNNFPTVKPSINFDFVNGKSFDSKLSFIRDSSAYYYDGKTRMTGRQNLTRWSEKLDEVAVWSYNTNISISSTTATTAPDGTNNAWKLTETAVLGYHDFGQALEHSFVQGAVYTVSIYAKAAERSHIVMYNTGGSGTGIAIFNLTTGEFERTEDRIEDYGYESVGDGWYRIWQTSRLPSSTGGGRTWYISIAGPNGETSYQGIAGNGIYLWGSQVEKRDFVTAYVKTEADTLTETMPVLVKAGPNEPRINHDPMTGQCKGVLAEARQSNMITHTPSTAVGKNNLSLVENTDLAPDGTKTAFKVIPNTSNTYHYMAFGGYATGTATYYTGSIYAKPGEYDNIALAMWDNTEGTYNLNLFKLSGEGSIVSGHANQTNAKIEEVGGGWYRCQVNIWLDSDVSTYLAFGPVPQNYLDDIVGQSATFTYSGQPEYFPQFAGDDFSGAYFWGAQIEESGAASSLIVGSNEVNGVQVTRDYDYIYFEGEEFDNLINPEEHTFYYEGDYTDNENQCPFLSMGNPKEGFFDQSFYVMNDPSFEGAPRTTMGIDTDGQTGQFLNNDTPIGSGIDPYTTFKYVATWGKDYFATTHTNAEEIVVKEDNIPVITGATQISFSQVAAYNGGAGMPKGHVRKFSYYPKRLSLSELNALIEE